MLASTCGDVPSKSTNASSPAISTRTLIGTGTGVVSDAVDEVGERAHAVRECGELGPHRPLGDALELVGVAVRVGAVSLDERGQAALPDPAGRELRAQVAEDVRRLAGVGLEQAQQRRVLDAGVDELGERNP